MQWFKHHSNFRNSPALKFVGSQLGDRGVAAVYRLYEVMTERFGVDNNFTGSLLLSPPYSEHWLAQEILTHEDDPDDDGWCRGAGSEKVTTKELRFFLGVCEAAGLLAIKREEDTVAEINEDGKSEPTDEKRVWLTIAIPGFAALADEYTARKRTSRSLETAKS